MTSSVPRVGSRTKLALAALITLLCLAPTPGDVGGCGQPAEDLDAEAFFSAKRETDCERCRACGLLTTLCEEACSESESAAQAFPEGCYPLVHDGEVCLRALHVASCDDYARFVAEEAPEVPTECNFCPPRGEP